MANAIDMQIERRIESLTVNLLECYEELDLIYRLSRGLKPTLDAQKSVELVLAEAMDIFEADMGWMIARGPASQSFTPLLKGTTPEIVDRLRLATLQDLIDRGKSHIVYSVREELGLEGEAFPGSLICAVLKTETAVYGALCVGRSNAGRLFTARDLKLSDVLSTQAAISIEGSLLQRKRLEEEQALIRIEEEIRLAREIQANLLPREPPVIPGYDIACRGVPARSVGGDYHDLIRIDEEHLGLCLADVTGHGMPAALLMANVQATIRSQALAAVSPAECARRANRLLFHSTDAGRFATCFYGVLHLPSGRLTYSNAGHDHPLIFSTAGEYTSLTAGGLILGVEENPGYEEDAFTIEPDQILVIYSDGVTDYFNHEGSAFGIEGLCAAVTRAHKGSAGQILEEILEAVGAHAGDRLQADDMTLVVLRRRGSEASRGRSASRP